MINNEYKIHVFLSYFHIQGRANVGGGGDGMRRERQMERRGKTSVLQVSH